MQLSVFHAPEQVPDLTSPEVAPPDCAVVVDVLRATTTIATALAAGAEAVQVFAQLPDLEAAASQWPSERRLLSGERGGSPVAGYNLGNSPLDYIPEVVADKRIFMSTTNGTRALACVRTAPVVLTAALPNCQAVVDRLVEGGYQSIWIVNSGWQGDYSLEDTFCSGAIVDRLQQASDGFKPANDETLAAVSLYRQWQDNAIGLLRAASHGQRLLRLDRDADLVYCADRDRLNVVPEQAEPGVLTV